MYMKRAWDTSRTKLGGKAQIKPRFKFVFPSDPFNVEILHQLLYTFLYKNTFSVKKNKKNNTVFLMNTDLEEI